MSGRHALVLVILASAASVLVPPAAGSASAGAKENSASPSPWPGGVWRPDPATYGMLVVSDLHITMSDGAVLIANVGYPEDASTGLRASGKFPVLLTQDPYPAEEQPNNYYVDRGYINAVVEVRGTGDTYGPGGSQLLYQNFGPRQTADGVALVHWAAHELAGSNGVIGLDGCSFLGIDQIFTAAAVGPNSPVKEILPACASNGYENYFAGGIPSQIAGLFDSPLTKTLTGTRNEAINSASSAQLEGQFEDGGPAAYDGTYWQDRTTYNVVPKIASNDIPALLWTGWYPTDSPGSLYEYAIFQNAYAHRPPFGPMAAHQQASGRYQIVVGPWMHAQGLDEGIQLEWYDTWLKGEHTGIAKTTTPMHLFELQANQWVNASTYPLSDSYTAYHLGSNDQLTRAIPKTAVASHLVWGQPTSTGTTLTYDTAPNKATSLIGGPIAATIFAASSNRNAELIATLSVIHVDGTKVQLTTGDIVGNLRSIDRSKSWYDRVGLMIRPDHQYAVNQFAAAGSVQRYDIELPPTLYMMEPGDYLELVISTQTADSDCASLISALSTPLPCVLSKPQAQTLPGGRYTLITSARFPSSLNIPILPSNAFPLTRSAVTPTSSGEIEPVDWSSACSETRSRC